MSESTENKQMPWRFQPGQSGNPAGRPKGSRQKLQTDFLNVLATDFEKHGKDAVVRMREEKPSDYIKAIASLMPKQLEIERPLQEMTDDDLINAISALQSFVSAQGTEQGIGNTQGRESAGDIPPLH